jgi:hypothetical protein
VVVMILNGVGADEISGVTFTTMFPDNVERIVVDGVMNAIDYYRAKWRPSLESVSIARSEN